MRPILFLLSLLLTGCVTDTAMVDDDRVFMCRNIDARRSAVVDSTATCPDGSQPGLYYAAWISTTGTCNVTRPSDIVGGMKGITRVFGCRKAGG